MATVKAYGSDGKLQDVRADQMVVGYNSAGKEIPVVKGAYVKGVSATNPTAKKEITTRGADGSIITQLDPLAQWKNQTGFMEAAKDIIRRKQAFNTDVQNQKDIWNQVGADTTPFGGPTAAVANNTKPYSFANGANFREMSPADQASIRASRDSAVSAHLSGLNDEVKYRETQASDTLKVLSDAFAEKTAALKEANQQKNEDARLQIERERNAILGIKDWNDATDEATKKAIEDRLKKAGIDLPDRSLPMPYTTIQTDYGSGHVSAYGSDKWANGLDFVIDGGTNAEIKLPYKFQVVAAGPNGNWGNQVKVKNLDTGAETWYSHLSKFANLKSGVTYDAGTSIGNQGSTGTSTGNHVDITMPKKGGGYLTAKEVAKAVGLGVTPSAKKIVIPKTIDVPAITEKYGLTKEELEGGDFTLSDIEQMQKEVQYSLKTETDAGAMKEADDYVSSEKEKGTDPSVIYSMLTRKFQNRFQAAELQSSMIANDYTWEPYTKTWQ